LELLGLIEDYRQGLLPLIVPLTLLKHHLNRYPVPEWVHQQVYLNRYPKELMLRNHLNEVQQETEHRESVADATLGASADNPLPSHPFRLPMQSSSVEPHVRKEDVVCGGHPYSYNR
jgi:hypothetical protein